MAVKLAFNKVEQFADGNGLPYSGAKLFTYTAGSTTKQTTYTESTGTTPNTNPIVLDSSGRLPQPIWLTTGVNYKFVLAPAADTDPPTSPIWTLDNISGINDTAVSAANEWISGPAPTFVSAVSFTLSGDQTSTFHVGRRLKSTNTSGTVYSTIITSAYAALTTITVVNDSGSLDSGLSAVSYGIGSANNPSISPEMIYRKAASVAAAATTNIWTAGPGDFVHITGTGGPITSFGTAPYAGAERTVIFDSTVTVTQNATSLICPGATNFFTAAGDRATVRADTTANAIFIPFRSSGLPPVGTSLPRSYLAGLVLSTAGGSATMTIAAGQAIDSTNTVILNLANSLAKTTSSWAVGAAGGLDTGAIANSTWYHFWLITRVDTGVVDVLISLSATAPTMPANYTLKRRIGSGKTDGSAQWTLFTQEGDNFLWAVPVSDYASANPGTAAVTRTLTVPTGVVVLPVHSVLITQGGTAAATYALYTSLAQTDTAPSATLFTVATGTDAAAVQNTASMVTNLTTNTSAQIRTRVSNSAGGTTLSGTTHGWVDHRGRDA